MFWSAFGGECNGSEVLLILCCVSFGAEVLALVKGFCWSACLGSSVGAVGAGL